MGLLQWEIIDTSKRQAIIRAKVPGGWLVMCNDFMVMENPGGIGQGSFSSSICYVPDPHDAWQPAENPIVD